MSNILTNITNDNDRPSTSTDAEPSHSQAISSSQATKAAAELDNEKAQREHHRTKFNDWLDNGYISFIFHLVIISVSVLALLELSISSVII